jgi:triacylglycerol lipase
MIRTCARVTIRSSAYRTTPYIISPIYATRQFSSSQWRKEDPRISDFGREIIDEFAVMREKYGTSMLHLYPTHGNS